MQSTQGSGLGTQATPCRGPLTAQCPRCLLHLSDPVQPGRQQGQASVDRCLGEMARQSLASQQGVLRDWNSAACSGLLLGKVPSVGIGQTVWVSGVTCVFCTGLELNLFDTVHVWGPSQPSLCSLPLTFVLFKQNGVTLSCPRHPDK